MKLFLIVLLAVFSPVLAVFSQSAPVISELTYTDIQMYSVRIIWKTDIPSDSKVRWMISDSNYQAISYTDSLYNPVLDTLHSVVLTFLNPFTLYNYNVSSSSSGLTSTSQNKMFATQSSNLSTIKVYFSKSVDTSVANGVIASGNVNLKGTLLNRIDNSGFNIDAAVSDFEDQADIVSALLKAKRDGVVIRFIYDGKQNSNWIDTLIAHGIKVIKRNFDNVNGHHLNTNFWIFDARCTCSGDNVHVWSSSSKLYPQSLDLDKNYAIEIKDRTLAYIYTREFDEMWGSFTDYPDTSRAKFGSLKRDNIPHKLNLNGVYSEVYFAPSDSIEHNVKKFLETSTSGIFFSAFDFKSQSLYQKLFELRQGRSIRGVFDFTNAGNGVFQYMNQWADVWVDSSSGRLHHNYFITDPVVAGQHSGVIAGSYSWTNESNLFNDEDLMIIKNPTTVNEFYQEFHQRYKESSGHPVSVVSISSELPSNFRLYQNYPNPFNPNTKIRFSLPVNTELKISVFNSLGQKVSELVSGKYNAGSYEINFDASGLSSGVYVCRVESGRFSESIKMILVK